MATGPFHGRVLALPQEIFDEIYDMAMARLHM